MDEETVELAVIRKAFVLIVMWYIWSLYLLPYLWYDGDISSQVMQSQTGNINSVYDDGSTGGLYHTK